MAEPRIEILPEAVAEAKAAREWYAERSIAASNGFMSELDRAIDCIRRSPKLWAKYLHGTRRYLLRRYPYLVVYRETSSVIVIIAVAHGKRRPGYWQHRPRA